MKTSSSNFKEALRPLFETKEHLEFLKAQTDSLEDQDILNNQILEITNNILKEVRRELLKNTGG